MYDVVIEGGDVVTESGVLPGHSVLVRDGVIAGVGRTEVPAGALVIDARGAAVLPGIVNAHAHGCTTGPLFSSGAEALSAEVARANLDRHLAAGVTTLVNVCGFGLEDSLIDHDVDVRLATNHLPAAFAAADLVDGSGLTDRVRAMAADRMVASGAVMIGEVGSGATLGGGVAAYRYVPDAVLAATGVALDPATATSLIDALTGPRRVEPPNDKRLRSAITASGLPPEIFDPARQAILDYAVAPVRTSLESFSQAVAAAEGTGVPAMFHVAGPSADELLRLARKTKAYLVAGHLNHPSIPAEDLIALARALRDAGVVVDVSSLDMVHAQRLVAPETADLLAAEGLVDTLSTDYAGGTWEPMLAVAQRWRAMGYVDLREVALMCSTRTADLLGLADRGRIAPGKRADLVIVDADDLESVRSVVVAGRVGFAS
jgi:imidazolonepropionase-like amidohydrolase